MAIETVLKEPDSQKRKDAVDQTNELIEEGSIPLVHSPTAQIYRGTLVTDKDPRFVRARKKAQQNEAQKKIPVLLNKKDTIVHTYEPFPKLGFALNTEIATQKLANEEIQKPPRKHKLVAELIRVHAVPCTQAATLNTEIATQKLSNEEIQKPPRKHKLVAELIRVHAVSHTYAAALNTTDVTQKSVKDVIAHAQDPALTPEPALNTAEVVQEQPKKIQENMPDTTHEHDQSKVKITPGSLKEMNSIEAIEAFLKDKKSNPVNQKKNNQAENQKKQTEASNENNLVTASKQKEQKRDAYCLCF
ncbi:hypothetical protein [Enterococcus ratti]|uniref:Uncharacterized protein n=1 Tax=Enterococcus ratti TaxID=150033 RepID=A0A1L8WL14_9ENTE|nr:hypothetical protein [Enterococcus ratti]OJG81713.1 hypothetical protein RV14_GL000240 [Enterococcus ratti]